MALKLTEVQADSFKNLARESYINELVEHFEENFPHIVEVMRPQELRDVLNASIDKCIQRGFTQKGPVRFNIDLMVIFGSGFDTDPQYRWIPECLEQYQSLPQIERSMKLYRLVGKYLKNISGSRGQHMIAAAERLEALNMTNVKAYKTGFERYMVQIFEDIYPQKYAQTAQEDLIALIEKGEKKALDVYGFNDAPQIALVVILMFLLGHEFDQDPFYPWALAEKTNSYGEMKAQRLEMRAKIWMRRAIENDQRMLNQTKG